MSWVVFYGPNNWKSISSYFLSFASKSSQNMFSKIRFSKDQEQNCKGFWDFTFWNHPSNIEDFTFREFFMDCLEKFCKTKVLLPFIPQVQKHCPRGCNFYRNTVVILKLTFFRKLLPPYAHIITLKIEFWHLSTSDATWGIEEHHTLVI